MRIEYRIVMSISLDSEADRDIWYDKIKTAFINAKPSSPGYLSATIMKDETQVREPSQENI